MQGQLYGINVDLNASPEYYRDLKEVLKIKKVKDFPLVRVGLQNRDGGYIMVNDFNPDGIAYSFGICNDVSWDNVMAELGYNIFMYDHTIERLPYNRKEFHFFKEGISGIDEENAPLKTLKHYMEINKHLKSKNLILKMDVEGAEWDFLETADSKILKQFDQIVFEFHEIVQTKREDKIIKLLVLEATYVSKEKYETIDDNELILPINLDAPNDIGRPDIILGAWNKPLNI